MALTSDSNQYLQHELAIGWTSPSQPAASDPCELSLNAADASTSRDTETSTSASSSASQDSSDNIASGHTSQLPGNVPDAPPLSQLDRQVVSMSKGLLQAAAALLSGQQGSGAAASMSAGHNKRRRQPDDEDPAGRRVPCANSAKRSRQDMGATTAQHQPSQVGHRCTQCLCLHWLSSSRRYCHSRRCLTMCEADRPRCRSGSTCWSRAAGTRCTASGQQAGHSQVQSSPASAPHALQDRSNTADSVSTHVPVTLLPCFAPPTFEQESVGKPVQAESGVQGQSQPSWPTPAGSHKLASCCCWWTVPLWVL